MTMSDAQEGVETAAGVQDLDHLYHTMLVSKAASPAILWPGDSDDDNVATTACISNGSRYLCSAGRACEGLGYAISLLEPNPLQDLPTEPEDEFDLGHALCGQLLGLVGLLHGLGLLPRLEGRGLDSISCRWWPSRCTTIRIS
jgi:hypothetical protein